MHLRFTTTASAQRGAELFAPVRALAEPIADLVGEMPAAALDAVHSDPTEPMPVWDGSALLSELPDAALDALLAVAGPGVETPLIMAELRALGGAIDRGCGEPDSVAGRGAAFADGGVLGPPWDDATSARLRDVQRRVDPDGVFRRA